MSLLPGFRYSSLVAPTPAGVERLTVDLAQQIPRRSAGVVRRRGPGYGAGLRPELQMPAAEGRYPLVVYAPGGGFVTAPTAMARRERAFIAAAGYVVASVGYRTIRQGATYTDGLADVLAAVDALTSRADEYRIDADRIAVWGESAGGYLASMAGLTDPRIRAVVDQFGASDLSRVADGFDAGMQAAAADPRHPIRRYGAIAANPIDLIGAGAPAFLLLHGDDDRVIPPDQTLELHNALRAAGADSTHYVVTGAGHGRLARSRAQTRYWTSRSVMTTIAGFLDHHLRS
ncbi:MAG TPA: prolyl oligopeptidase family serine peptidase [Asanoa sp.]|nr:prolyl oligopeptidase family serine peptidase [Asanoa sp.]